MGQTDAAFDRAVREVAEAEGISEEVAAAALLRLGDAVAPAGGRTEDGATDDA